MDGHAILSEASKRMDDAARQFLSKHPTVRKVISAWDGDRYVWTLRDRVGSDDQAIFVEAVASLHTDPTGAATSEIQQCWLEIFARAWRLTDRILDERRISIFLFPNQQDDLSSADVNDALEHAFHEAEAIAGTLDAIAKRRRDLQESISHSDSL